LVTTLAKLGIDRFYFHKNDLELVLAYLNNHLFLLDASQGETSKEKLLVLVEHLNLSLHRAMKSNHLGRHIDLARIQVDRLIRELQQTPFSLKLVWELLYRDYCLYKHSVNVCLLSVGLMLFLHKSRQESLILGLAGLFHDLGMSRIPEELLYKEEPLEPEEWERLKQHPETGHEMLAEAGSLPPEVRQTVLEHHENFDGSGYPRGLPAGRQHPWSRILRLMDAYDGLTCHRPYRQALTPFAALKTITAQTGSAGGVFDPRTLKNFIRFLALP
jgi:HD-GYP domain-containing protein (c-di-GMP phosphodiesterase class II)